MGSASRNGHKMSYDVIAPTDVQSVPRTFQIIQADFQKIGVKLRQQSLDSTARLRPDDRRRTTRTRTSISPSGTGRR